MAKPGPRGEAGRVTLAQVAKACGVSTATASKVLSRTPHASISEAVRREITRRAEAMGYRPNLGTRLMQAKATGNIGLALARPRVMEEEHVRDLLFLLIQGLAKRGLRSQVGFLTEADPSGDLETMVDAGCDAFIVFGSPTDPAGVQDTLARRRRNFVGFQASRLARNIESDTASAVARILTRWSETGARQIRLFVPDAPHLGREGNRMAGLRLAFPGVPDRVLVERHLRFLMDFETHLAGGAHDLATRATRELLEAEPGVDALLHYTDITAAGALPAIRASGRTRDFRLAGINDSALSRLGPEPFTSVKHDLPSLANRLMDEMNGSGPLEERLPAEVLFRPGADGVLTPP